LAATSLVVHRIGDQRALVVYHNKYAEVAGWIRLSAAFPVKTGDDDERSLIQNTLGQGLGLYDDQHYFTIFREHINGLEYIRNNRELHHHGLYVELGAYKCQVFLDFRQVQDDESGSYASLTASLAGRGVKSVSNALKEMYLAPVLSPFRQLVNPGMLNWLIQNRWSAESYADADFDRTNYDKALKEFEDKSIDLLTAIKEFEDGEGDAESIAAEMVSDVRVILALPVLKERFPEMDSREYQPALAFLENEFTEDAELRNFDPGVWGTLLAWSIVRRLGKIVSDDEFDQQSRTWIDEWLLGNIIAEVLQEMGVDQETAIQRVALVRLFSTVPGLYTPDADDEEAMAEAVLRAWLADVDVQRYLFVHSYNDVVWFNREAFESLCWWAFAMSAVRAHKAMSAKGPQSEMVCDTLLACFQVVETLLAAAEESGYQVNKLLEIVSG